MFEPWHIEDESVQAVITSPPYYALRKYSIPDVIIGGEKDCMHEWGNVIAGKEDTQGFARNRRGLNKAAEISDGHIRTATTDIPTIKRESCFCVHCNAWKGQYGLEPTPKMYIEHTRLWAKEAWRVLRNDGIFFLNIADSYPSGGGKAVEQSANRQSAINTGAYPDYSPSAKLRQSIPKCQLLIPHRVAIALVESDDNDIYELNNDLTNSQSVAIISEILQHNKGKDNEKTNEMQEM